MEEKINDNINFVMRMAEKMGWKVVAFDKKNFSILSDKGYILEREEYTLSNELVVLWKVKERISDIGSIEIGDFDEIFDKFLSLYRSNGIECKKENISDYVRIATIFPK